MAVRALTTDRRPTTQRVANSTGLVEAMRERTRMLHVQAERTGAVRSVLRGVASRREYALLLRNLLPAYQELERGLERHRALPLVRPVARPELYRTVALTADIERLEGRERADALPLMAAGERYAAHLRNVSDGRGELLVAHAYVRYFGDLSGGQILRGVLARTLGLTPEELQFYSFPAIRDGDAFKEELRAAIDRAAGPGRAIIDEAVRAFELNIDVSEAVHQAAIA